MIHLAHVRLRRHKSRPCVDTQYFGVFSRFSLRLRVTDLAREFLFADARLWADTLLGDLVGRKCDWTGIYLLIFPHGKWL